MPSAAELRILRFNTVAFIEADPRTVVLTRYPRVPNGAGGSRPGTPAPQPAQVMRVIPVESSRAVERVSVDGATVTPSWVLMGRWDANMKRGDRFPLQDGTTGELVYVHEKHDYEMKGEVVVR